MASLSTFSDDDVGDEATDQSCESGTQISTHSGGSRVTRSRMKLRSQSPSTPIPNLVSHMRKKLEKELAGQLMNGRVKPKETLHHDNDKTSPGLTQLRNTPRQTLAEKQKLLVQKHQSAKNRSGHLSVGGGVSIWPEMDNMRLTTRETVKLGCVQLALVVTTAQLFHWLHGHVSERLLHYHKKVSMFPHQHPLVKDKGDEDFKDSVLSWHTRFLSVMEDIQASFDASLSRSSVGYQLSVLLYIVGIGTLLYYLADNMLAKSKLTPWRIKVWVSLLVILGVWTLLAIRLLLQAQALELAVENCVRHLSSQLADLVYLPLDLTAYRDVAKYWEMLCLPPTTQGTLSILGVIMVADIQHYLQYYSLPIITALLTPVIKLIISLKSIYSVKPH